MSENHLPVASSSGDIALDASGAADVTSAVQALVASFNHRAEVFDDVHLTLNVETSVDGAHRSTFSYRAVQNRRT